MLSRLLVLSLVLFCFELGLFLLVIPWSRVWEQNYFLYRWPQLASWLMNYYLRGFISGLGLVDLGLSVWYAALFRQLLARLRQTTTPSAPSQTSRSVTRGETT